MSARIIQIIKPLEKILAFYIKKDILEKYQDAKVELLRDFEDQGFNFPLEIYSIANNFTTGRFGDYIEKSSVPVFALIERGKKTTVEPLHLYKGGLVLSDDIEGYLGMLNEDATDSKETEIEFRIKALEYLRDG